MSSPSLDSLVELAAQLAAQRAIDQAKATGAQVRHGTVVDLYSGGIGIHDVLMDGDVQSIAVHDITMGFPLLVGDRVTVLFAPPHQALIIGKVPTQNVGNLVTILEYEASWQTDTPITVGANGFQYGWYVDLFGFILGITGFKLGTGGNVTGTGGLNATLPTALHPIFAQGGIAPVPWIGAGRSRDADANAGAGAFHSCTGQIGDPFGNNILFNLATAGQIFWDSLTPFNWAVNDECQTLFVYPREPG
jgi:hypothetical protein